MRDREQSCEVPRRDRKWPFGRRDASLRAPQAATSARTRRPASAARPRDMIRKGVEPDSLVGPNRFPISRISVLSFEFAGLGLVHKVLARPGRVVGSFPQTVRDRAVQTMARRARLCWFGGFSLAGPGDARARSGMRASFCFPGGLLARGDQIDELASAADPPDASAARAAATSARRGGRSGTPSAVLEEEPRGQDGYIASLTRLIRAQGLNWPSSGSCPRVSSNTRPRTTQTPLGGAGRRFESTLPPSASTAESGAAEPRPASARVPGIDGIWKP
jgi:hypothetical protein